MRQRLLALCIFLPALALLLAACAPPPPSSPSVQVLRDLQLLTDTVWQGRLVIDGSVRVAKGATLTILPGSDISFVRRDADGDGLGDGTLIVEGVLRAEGTRQAPIRFRSAAADPRPGDWLEIRVDFSPEVRLRWCEITDSAYTLHAHFTRGFMEDCTIRRNIDGSRLGEASFAIRHCLIEENTGKGINFRNSQVQIERNIIRRNGTGIFLFESDRPHTIADNNLYDNGDNFRLGDFWEGDFDLVDNWWGEADPAAAAATIHDGHRDPEIPGRVRLVPAPAWIGGTGPRDALTLKTAWRFATGGFVDAAPVAGDDSLFIPSWSGQAFALDRQGRQLWVHFLGDVVDAAPALDGRALYLQTWQREVFALDRRDGRELWRFTYSPSTADDHRQGGVLRFHDLLLVPAWNGTLYALGAEDGLPRWQARLGQPLRAAPVADGDRLYVASGTGSLTALTGQGAILWQASLGAPLLAPPAVTPEGPVAVTREGRLIAFTRDGRERWRQWLAEGCFHGGPAADAEAVYQGTDEGHLWKLAAASGRPIWRYRAGAPLSGTPLVVAGRLYFGDNSGVLHVVNADSGQALTTFQTEGEIQGTPMLLDSRLFFGSRDHQVYALDLVEDQKREE